MSYAASKESNGEFPVLHLGNIIGVGSWYIYDVHGGLHTVGEVQYIIHT